MAVTTMKSVTIVGHEPLRREVLSRLHSVGVLQLTDVNGYLDRFEHDQPTQAGDHASPAGTDAQGGGQDGQGPVDAKSRSEAAAAVRLRIRQEMAARLSDLDRRLGEVTTCLTYVQRYDPLQKGLVESFLAGKEGISPDVWQQAEGYDYSQVFEQCQNGEARLNEIRSRELELGARLKELQPLAGLGLDMAALDGTATVAVFFGQTSEARLAALEAALAGSGATFHLEHLGAIGRQLYLAILYMRDEAAVPDILRASGLEAASVPATGTTAQAAVAAAESELAALAAEREAIAAAGKELAAFRPLLWATYDHLLLERQQQEAQSLIGQTDRTFVVQGWCPDQLVPHLEKVLEAYATSTAYTIRDPERGDEPPVILDNGKATAPFEIVTNIYGWPSYREVDPTPVLAPFFALFFALALTDAGYGILMMAYCIWMMRRQSTPKSAHKFFRLLAYGGGITTVVGALTGGWFGNALDFLPAYMGWLVNAKNAIIIFDPVTEPMTLMFLSLGLGIIHLLCGIGVKMYRNIRDGNTKDALIDQGLWLLLLPGIVVFAVAGAAGLGDGVANAGRYVAIAAAIGLVLTQGRASRNIVARLGGGLYSLYGLVGYLSDTLSYTRLLALGLATASLGMAINQIAMMVRPVPVVGIILMLMVMAFGHGLSLLINVFGAFIHSARLQFVEFFTKFFEGGGKPFKPFAERPRYTQVEAD